MAPKTAKKNIFVVDCSKPGTCRVVGIGRVAEHLLDSRWLGFFAVDVA